MKMIKSAAHYEAMFVSDEARKIILNERNSRYQRNRRANRKAERIAAENADASSETVGEATDESAPASPVES